MGRGGAEQRLPAHKFVLSVGSAVFDAMFNSTLATQVGMLKGQCHEMHNFFFATLKHSYENEKTTDSG